MTALIYLASQSPRRSQLLDQIGVTHEKLLPEPGDDAEALEARLGRESPTAYVQRVTALKLAAARARLAATGWPAKPILCADTTVALGPRILGKPADADEAKATLTLLSDRSHRVLTAIALWDGRRVRSALSTSTVTFAPLPARVIAHYVASGEPFGKAGAYAIQGAMSGWVQSLRGSYSAIMGLPLYETTQLLLAARLPLPCMTSSSTGPLKKRVLR